MRYRNISVIQQWIVSEDWKSGLDENGYLPELKWPESIKSFFPRQIAANEVLVSEYVRTIWGSGILGAYDLVIGPDLEKISSSESEKFKYRIWIDPNAFVASEIVAH